MYHIKPDKRSQKSAELITEGLNACLKEKPFSKITITDVQKASTVGRATFYRLFDALPDVLSWECDQAVSELVGECKKRSMTSGRETLVYFFSYGIRHRDLLQTIVESGHLEVLYDSFSRNSDGIAEIISFEDELSPVETGYLLKALSLGMAGIFEVWIKNGGRDDAEAMTDFFEKTVSVMYRSLRK